MDTVNTDTAFTLYKTALKMILIIHESWKSANYMCFVYRAYDTVPQGIWQEMLWVCEAKVSHGLMQYSNQICCNEGVEIGEDLSQTSEGFEYTFDTSIFLTLCFIAKRQLSNSFVFMFSLFLCFSKETCLTLKRR